MEETIFQVLSRGVALDEKQLEAFCDAGECYAALDDWEALACEFVRHRRWSLVFRTVLRHRATGETWACEWDRAATEYQEDSYWNQPYRVEAVDVSVKEYRPL